MISVCPFGIFELLLIKIDLNIVPHCHVPLSSLESLPSKCFLRMFQASIGSLFRNKQHVLFRAGENRVNIICMHKIQLYLKYLLHVSITGACEEVSCFLPQYLFDLLVLHF